jgi:hypothetical protein
MANPQINTRLSVANPIDNRKSMANPQINTRLSVANPIDTGARKSVS